MYGCNPAISSHDVHVVLQDNYEPDIDVCDDVLTVTADCDHTQSMGDDDKAPTSSLSTHDDGFVRVKLIRVELPDDLQPADPATEIHIAINVKERVEVDGECARTFTYTTHIHRRGSIATEKENILSRLESLL
jgi:hypothetical protein